MKKLLLSMAALTALAGAAAPAAAQSWRDDDRYDGRYDDQYDHDRYDRDGGGYSDRLGRQIERAENRGQISRREAWRLRSALRAVDDLERRYRADGRLSGWEASDLNRRKDRIAQELNQTRGDRDYGYREDWRR